jgi:hypothetical protein
MWRLLPEVPKGGLRGLSRLRKARIYADEDIEDEIVALLRREKVNVASVKELGHSGKPDTFQSNLAYKLKRFILTKNTKHFYEDDRAIPFHRIYGVIALDVDTSNTKQRYRAVLSVTTFIVPFGEHLIGSKIKINSEEISIKRVDLSGIRSVTRYRSDKHNIYEWIDD